MLDHLNKKVVAVGMARKGLYLLDDSFRPDAHVVSNVSVTRSCNSVLPSCLWHARLGHPSDTVLSKLSLTKDAVDTSVCDVCHIAKQTRNSFGLSEISAVACFELLHIDIWGPYGIVSISGAKFFLTIVDDYSQSVWTFLMQSKAQAVCLLANFITYAATQFGLPVKMVRTDNGAEFLSSDCQNLFQKHGIFHQRSCPYTPQQNGVVERKHRYVIQVARALLHHASLPQRFWGEAVLTATHLINRLPSIVLKWKCPVEILTNKRPDFSRLKIFGCLCFVSNLDPHKRKFDPRAKKCVFLGYVPNCKGYKVFDLQDQKVLVSRDVVFYEDKFPFQDTSLHETHDVPLPITIEDVFVNTPPDQSSHNGVNDDSPTTTTTTSASPSQSPDTTDVSSSLPSTVVPVSSQPRRSSRQHKTPHWLNDYVTCAIKHPTAYPYLTSSTFSSQYKTFLGVFSQLHEPQYYHEAKDIPEWQDAMQHELQALEHNHTWTIVDLPPGKHSIGCRWVYKIKLRADGTIERYKARLVAKGYNQVEGIDFSDSFSPVAKAVTVRILLALAAQHNWLLHQFDVNNAFLHGYLDEVIYMDPPPGYHVPKGRVCQLRRSLYGLKQASRQWNTELTRKLQLAGFHQSSHDHCLFTKGAGVTFIALLVYVDDLLVAGPSISEVNKVKQCLHDAFSIKDLGEARFFLGLEIARSSKGMYINQRKYTLDLLSDTGLLGAKPTNTPMVKNQKFIINATTKLQDPERYRRLIGRLLYLCFTRPDISYGTQQLSQYVHEPHQCHWDAALYILRYLKGNLALGLFYPITHFSSTTVEAFCDADWAACHDTRRSLTGYCIFLGNSLISWKTKKQTTVSRSSVEAEYPSLSSTVCELLWIDYLLQDLQQSPLKPIPMWCDNQAALHIMANPVFHERTKHLEIDCHLVRDQFKKGFVLPKYVSSAAQLADLFTKSLPGPRFSDLVCKLGLLTLHQSQLERGC